MKLRRPMAALVFTLGYAINPGAVFGCGGGQHEDHQPQYTFGETELDAMLTDLNVRRAFMFTTLETPDKEYVVELALTRSETTRDAAMASGPSWLARSARACGTETRTFFRAASACVTLYETDMPVEAELTLYERTGSTMTKLDAWQATGTLRVIGVDLSRHWGITLTLAGEGRTLELREGSPGVGLEVGAFNAVDLGIQGTVAP